MKSQIGKYVEQGPEGSCAQELLCPRNWDVPPSPHVGVFTNSEAHQIALFKSFHRSLISSPTPLPRGGGMKLRVPTL